MADRFQPIYWIASYPKSGNTWVRLFLQVLLRDMGTIPGKGIDFKQLGPEFPSDSNAELFTRLTGRRPSELSNEELAEARLGVQEQIAREHPYPPFVKTHQALGLFYGKPSHNMKFSRGALYLVRNPLDVLVSFSGHMSGSITQTIGSMALLGNLARGGDKVAPQAYGSWWQNVASWTGKKDKKILTMRYEDLVADPVAGFTRIVHHMKIPATPGQIAAAVEATRLAKLRDREKKEGFGEKLRQARFFGEGKVGGWQSMLSQPGAKVMVEVHAREMNKFGYLTEDVLRFARIDRATALRTALRLKKNAKNNKNSKNARHGLRPSAGQVVSGPEWTSQS
ncbi:MAG: sulfotransferase domain-containing protein [Alphaproteobacteria bacterium]|nr:sulfotransferase domain-containing protein [Alphaproteobacteria bacterium]